MAEIKRLKEITSLRLWKE